MPPRGHQRARRPRRPSRAAQRRRARDWPLPGEVTLLPSPTWGWPAPRCLDRARCSRIQLFMGGGCSQRGEQLPRSPWSRGEGATGPGQGRCAVQAGVGVCVCACVALEALAGVMLGPLLGSQTPSRLSSTAPPHISPTAKRLAGPGSLTRSTLQPKGARAQRPCQPHVTFSSLPCSSPALGGRPNSAALSQPKWDRGLGMPSSLGGRVGAGV